MRRIVRIVSIGAAVGLGVSLAACSESGGSSGSSTSAATTGDIKVGAVLDITGAGASLGVPERQTLEMLADQVNSSGGVNGRQIKLLIEDNQSTEDAAAKATNKLLSTEKVDILIGASRTGPSLAMRPIAEQAQKPMISLAANQSIINGAKWIFKTAQNDRVVVEKIVDDMKAEGITKIAIARDASGFGEGIPEMFTEIGKPAGITVVKVEKFAPDATDFTAQMVSIRDSQPQAVVIWGIPPAASLAQVAYKRLERRRAGLPVARHRQPGLPRHGRRLGRRPARAARAHGRRRPAQGGRPAEAGRHEVHRGLQGQVRPGPLDVRRARVRLVLITVDAHQDGRHRPGQAA